MRRPLVYLIPLGIATLIPVWFLAWGPQGSTMDKVFFFLVVLGWGLMGLAIGFRRPASK